MENKQSKDGHFEKESIKDKPKQELLTNFAIHNNLSLNLIFTLFIIMALKSTMFSAQNLSIINKKAQKFINNNIDKFSLEIIKKSLKQYI